MQGLLEWVRPYAMPTSQFLGLMSKWDEFRSTMLCFMAKYDAMLCPVAAYPAMPHGQAAVSAPAFAHCQTYNLPFAIHTLQTLGVVPEVGHLKPI